MQGLEYTHAFFCLAVTVTHSFELFDLFLRWFNCLCRHWATPKRQICIFSARFISQAKTCQSLPLPGGGLMQLSVLLWWSPLKENAQALAWVQMDVEVLYADLLIYFKQCSRNIIVFPRKYLNLWKSWGYQHVRAHWQKPRKKSRAPACSSGLPCCCSVPGAWAVVTPSVGLSCSLHPRLAVVCGVLWAAWKDSRLLFSPKWRRGSWLGWNGLWYWQSALSPLGAHSSLCGHPLPACLSCI